MPKTAPTKPVKPKAPTKPRKKASPKAKASLQAQAPIVSELVEHRPIASNAPVIEIKQKRRGRDTVYTEELGTQICEMLSDGTKIGDICKIPGMPSEPTIRAWSIDFDHPFAGMYAHAREVGYTKMGDEILSIADNSELDHNDRRIRIDTRKWMLSKMLPKVYGDKLDIEARVTVQTLTDDQINARLMQLAEATANAARSE